MNPTTKVIIQQLENEGVNCIELFGRHLIEVGKGSLSFTLGSGDNLGQAVKDSISTMMRIGYTLCKLRDSLESEQVKESGDLLVGPDEVENPGYTATVILGRKARAT